MQSNNKQIGTLAGHHNQPAGPANTNKGERNECIKKERDMRRAAS